MAKKTIRVGRIYPTYLFKDHDPVLDFDDYLVDREQAKLKDVAADAGVTRSTLASWKKRKTKRPQFATIAAVCSALGAKTIPINPIKGKGGSGD
jgi:DNA-binding Xre family transcriptional regulator